MQQNFQLRGTWSFVVMIGVVVVELLVVACCCDAVDDESSCCCVVFGVVVVVFVVRFFINPILVVFLCTNDENLGSISLLAGDLFGSSSSSFDRILSKLPEHCFQLDLCPTPPTTADLADEENSSSSLSL